MGRVWLVAVGWDRAESSSTKWNPALITVRGVCFQENWDFSQDILLWVRNEKAGYLILNCILAYLSFIRSTFDFFSSEKYNMSVSEKCSEGKSSIFFSINNSLEAATTLFWAWTTSFSALLFYKSCIYFWLPWANLSDLLSVYRWPSSLSHQDAAICQPPQYVFLRSENLLSAGYRDENMYVVSHVQLLCVSSRKNFF